MAGFKYDIQKTIFSVASDSDGWNLELNLISWNGREAKYDLRKWSDDHEKLGKGCYMSEDEVVLLVQKSKEIIKEITGEEVKDDKVEKVNDKEEKESKSIKEDDKELPFD